MSEVHVAVEQGALQQVYDERNRLVALAVVLACEAGYRVGLLDDADEPDWPVLAIELPTGQVAWHVPQDVANLLSEVQEVEVTRFVCDGHDGAAQAQRIERFIQAETWPDGADSLVRQHAGAPHRVEAIPSSASPAATTRASQPTYTLKRT